MGCYNNLIALLVSKKLLSKFFFVKGNKDEIEKMYRRRCNCFICRSG